MKLVKIIVVVMVLLALGFTRLAFDEYRPSKIDSQEAFRWATCLGEDIIPAGKTISVRLSESVPLSEEAPGLSNSLPFQTTVAIEAPEGVDAAGATLTKLAAGSNIEAKPDSGVFRLPDKMVYEIDWSDAHFVLDLRNSNEIVTVGPAQGAIYHITATKDISLEAGQPSQKRMIPANTEGTQPLGTAQPLTFVTVQALAVHPWLEGMAPTLLPVRSSGQKGLSGLSIEARQPGLDFARRGFGFAPVRAKPEWRNR